ncbi:MAG: hypothetical protein WBD02_03105 [Acidimicrobiia bacterium]
MNMSRRPRAARVMLIIDPRARAIVADDSQCDWVSSEDETRSALVRYLALVAELRGVPEHSRFRIRSADIDVLARAFETTVSDMRTRLKELQTDSRVLVVRRTLRGSVLLPAGGLLLAATAIGGLVLVGADRAQAASAPLQMAVPQPISHETTVPSSSTSSRGTREIGDAIAVSRPEKVTYDIADTIAAMRPPN